MLKERVCRTGEHPASLDSYSRELGMGLRHSAIGCALTGSLLFWASSAWSRDDEASLKERVLKTYPERSRALETHFAKAFGSVTVSEEHWVGQPRHIRVGWQVQIRLKVAASQAG